MTPSEYLIAQLESEEVDELEYCVLIKKHKNGCVSYGGNRASRVDINSLCSIVEKYTLSEIIASDVKAELSE